MTRFTLSIFALVLLSATVAGCGAADQNGFGIYLLKDQMTAGQAQKLPLDAPALGERIISTADIVSYTQATHEIELTPEAYARVQALYKLPVEVAGIPFIVCVGKERIYGGGFWTPLSSLSFDGVFINQPFAQDQHTIRIDLGYPSPLAFSGTDPRSDSRIFSALSQAGKLKVGQPLSRLRIKNSGTIPIKDLVVVFPDERIAFGDVEAGATTDFKPVASGVYAYAAYMYDQDGKSVMQPVTDWIGEKPLVGELFTYTIDRDPTRAPAPQIRLDEVTRDK